eukprot:COSAG02_NODE_31278_length_536_cov_0.940503_1_plen_41_part_10
MMRAHVAANALEQLRLTSGAVFLSTFSKLPIDILWSLVHHV